MSATLDVEGIARLLGNAQVVSTLGREFPVETRYLPAAMAFRLDPHEIERRVVTTTLRAVDETGGDMLVFLPGTAEIRRVAERLIERCGSGVDIMPLHANLTPDEQDRAILPSSTGRRKMVLATSVAETSLTIEGVRVVVDSGVARVPRFSPRTGMTRLETVRVSRASADQRRGRAGRVAPGVCYRLWTEIEQGQLVPYGKPEIMEADLAPLALELAVAGIQDPLELTWLDPPPAAALSQAREILRELDAIDEAGRATSQGRAMAAIAVHPRLAHMLLRARALGRARTAGAIAALLGERDILRTGSAAPDADLRRRLDALVDPVARKDVDPSVLRRVTIEADRLARLVGGSSSREHIDSRDAGLLVAFAYPDRIARRRGAHGHFLLRNGRGARFESRDPLGAEELVAVAAVDDRQPESRIFLAAPFAREELENHFGDHIVTEREVMWDDRIDAVLATRRVRLGAIVLSEHTMSDSDPGEVARALVRGLAAQGIDSLPWSDRARNLRHRLAFLHHFDGTWPDVSDAALASSMEHWLTPRIQGMHRRAEVARLDLGAALLELLDWRQRAALDELAPTHLTVPSGSSLPIDYSEPSAPVLAVRLQEMFGARDTPRIFSGRVALTLHLLSPAQRPVQITRDLARFWMSSYYDVQRELRGRYPKHDWPDDPLTATPTARVKRR
jgi:ATP-dependent helicase HrpB